MKLYKLTTGLGDYWVIANDPTQAEHKLTTILDVADYGLTKKRIVTQINLIADEIKDEFLTDKFLIR